MQTAIIIVVILIVVCIAWEVYDECKEAERLCQFCDGNCRQGRDCPQRGKP